MNYVDKYQKLDITLLKNKFFPLLLEKVSTV